jgi:PAS domain S-box-containing protein
MFFENMIDGFAYHKLVIDEAGKPVDYVFLGVNNAFERMIGLKKEKIIGKKVTEVLKGIENDPADWIGTYGKVALTCKSIQFENYAKPLDKWFNVSAYCPEKGYFVTLFEDITERKKIEKSLKESDERFRIALKNAPVSVAVQDCDLRYIWAFNQRTAQPDQILGKFDQEIFTPQKAVHLHKIKSRVINRDIELREQSWYDRPTGRIFLDVTWSPIHDTKGKVIGVASATVDLTKIKLVEEALKESEQRWSTTLSSIGDAVIATDVEGKVTFLNGVAEKLTGWTQKEAKHKPIQKIFNIINEKTRAKVENPVTKVLMKGLIVGLANHTVLKRKDRTEVPIDDSGAPIKDKDGNITGVVLVFRDITERKKAQEKIGQQAFMIENANDAIIGYDREQRVTFWNKSAEHLYGYTSDEALGKSSVDLFKPTYSNVAREELISRLATEGHLETESIRQTKTGKSLDVEAHVILLRDESGESVSYVSVDRDITERKKSEIALQRQAALIDLSPDAIIVKNVDETITFWSKGAESLYGWTKAEAIGKKTHELFKTRFPVSLKSVLADLKKTQHWSGELVHKTKGGKDIVVQSWWLAEKTEHDEITSILESNIDLTERKNAEREITRLASFPTFNPNPVLEVDFQGKITYANPAAKTLFPDLAKLGRKHSLLTDWQDIVKTLEGKTKKTFGREVQVCGHWYHEQYYLVPETQQIRIYTVDIDELKLAEEARIQAQIKLEENAILLEEYANQMEELANHRAAQLKDAERMAAIGQTAGMVGHDIRNPLQAITSDMYLITEEAKSIPDGESKQAILESVESINENITYIDKIVSDLQDYTRPLKPNIQIANLSELIQSAIMTINIPRRIELETDIEENSIKTDVAYLRRILTNLLTNAVQAMPIEGKLTVKVEEKRNWTKISIQDTGVGIPENIKTKMFTPLFTTKSKGQGLGLAVVKRLVEALNGKIHFESQENQGTKFIVELQQTNIPEKT